MADNTINLNLSRVNFENPVQSFPNWEASDGTTLEVVDWTLGFQDELGGKELKDRIMKEVRGKESFQDAQVVARVALVKAFMIKVEEDKVSANSKEALNLFKTNVEDSSVLGRFKNIAELCIKVDPETSEPPATYWDQLVEFSRHYQGPIVYRLLSVCDRAEKMIAVSAALQPYYEGVQCPSMRVNEILDLCDDLSLLAGEKRQNAIQLMQQAIEDGYVFARVKLAQLYYSGPISAENRDEELNMAVTLCDEAISDARTSDHYIAEAHSLKGEAYIAQGKHQEGIGSLKIASEMGYQPASDLLTNISGSTHPIVSAS